MTKEKLEQYLSINAEINELEAELRKSSVIVSDVVKGSSDEYPYTQHGVTVHGLSATTFEISRLIEQKRIDLCKSRLEIEEFMDNVKDSEIRRIIRLKYINSLTWKQVAFRLGWYDEQIPRKKIDRFLEKYEMYENNGL